MGETTGNAQGAKAQKWYEELLSGMGESIGTAVANFFGYEKKTSGADGKQFDNTTMYIVIGFVIVMAIILIFIFRKK